MLRYDFLPSDTHPMLLALGERADLLALESALLDFARTPRRVALDTLVAVHPATRVTIVLTPGTYGLRHEEAGDYLWSLDADRAAAFAGLVAALAVEDRAAGSEQLETGAADEIPVKISRGEFTEDFLVATF